MEHTTPSPALADLSSYCERHLVDFIQKMDQFFKPSIAARMDLNHYIQKLKTHGIMIGTLKPDQTVASLIGFYANDNVSRTAFITYLAVDPELQGQQVGKALVQQAKILSARQGMTTITLTTWAENHGALKLYRAMDFTETDRQKTDERTTVFLEAKL